MCAELGLASPPLPPAPVAPVAFAQPTLVLAGGEDPVTPATVSDEASAGLPDRQFLEFAGVGHAVLLNNRCGRDSIAAWLADPRRDVTSRCDRAAPAYDVVGTGGLHPTTQVARTALAAADGDWLAVALPAAFALLCLGWLTGWLARWLVPIVAGRRRGDTRGVLATGVAPLAGTAFLVATGVLIWFAANALPIQLVVGVPRAVPWLGLLLVAGAAGLGLGVRRTRTRRGRLAYAAAVLLWVAFAAWFFVFVEPPS